MTRACHGPIRAAIGDAFSDDEIDAALGDLTRRIERHRRSGMGLDEAVEAAREEALKDALMEDAIKRRMEIYAKLARARRDDFFAGLDGTEDKNLAAFLVGDETGRKGTARSVDAQARALHVEILSELFAELDEAGLLGRITNPFSMKSDKAFQRALAREISRLNGRADIPMAGDVEVQTVARVFHKAQQKAMDLQNEAGAWIRPLDGYVTRQTHDPVKISGGFVRGMSRRAQAGARTRWVDDILPLLDERSFEGVEPTAAARRAHLEKIWSNIVSGDHHKLTGFVHDLDGYTPPPSKARSVSAHRVLHFRDPDAWITYNEKYGRGSLIEAMFANIERGSSNAALMRAWGPSPEAAYQAHLKRAIEAAKARGDAATARDLAGWKMRARFDELTGEASAPESPRLHAISRAIRLQQSLSKLGGMVVSAISDFGFAGDTLRRAGVDYLSAYDGLAKSIAGLPDAQRKVAARYLGVTARIMAGDASSRFNVMDGAYGVMGRMNAMFYRLNAFTWQQSRLRTGVGAVLSLRLGDHRGTAFELLPPEVRGGLERFDITGPLWEAVRTHARKIDDSYMLTPDAVDAASAQRLAKALGMKASGKAALEQARREARLRIQSYFLTLTDDALTEPRARERAILRFGTKPGTPAGFAMELITQFKTFPTAVLLRHGGPAMQAARNGDGMALVHMMAMTTILGYAAVQAKQLLKAREPLPLNRNTFIASLIQGGGLGIYGDFLFADFNRYGRSPLATLAGPAIGEIEGFLQVLSALRSGDDPSARAVRLVSGNIPFGNLFYTKAALDYLLLYRLQEAVSPGYLARYERRMEEETGAAFILSPQIAGN